MNWLNYHHLLYFFTIANEGSVSAAAEKLRLTQPTLSMQLKQLEESLETALFERRGRTLHLTETGQLVYRYADNIFSLGKELQAVLSGSPSSFNLKLRVGVSSALPKFVIHKTLAPIYQLEEQIKLECTEDKRENLLKELAAYNIDLVLSDQPFGSEIAVKAFNHQIGSSGISLYGSAELIKSIKGRGANKFQGAPFILPTRNTMMRKAMDRWFDKENIQPTIVAEFEDSAVLKTFGSEGLGLFPVASIVEADVERHYDVSQVARLPDVREDFYAISLERKFTHPGIVAIVEAARKNLN